ncbi:MAG: MBL fold metallo-hydrolase [Chlamydiae bacterium]|nr:MBL fold metallo-hydrolase [Chlamydiota bacterium]
MRNSLIILGSGGSLGVPVVGCSCKVCHSSSEKNKRLRSSVFLKIQGKNILIDPGPDVRLQCLKAGIDHLDGVILTHVHHDHAAGVDELRVFPLFREGKFPFLLSEFSHEELVRRFHYIQKNFVFQPLKEMKGETEFLGINIRFFTYHQLGIPVLGLRFGNVAYVTDIKYYTDEIIEDLQGLDFLIISAIRKENPSPAHLLIPEALDLINKIAPKHTYLTHLSHEVEHEEINEELPSNIELGYDGLEICFV